MSVGNASNPWLGRKYNKDMMDKLLPIFEEAWANDGNFADVQHLLDDDLEQFLGDCLIDKVDGDEETITITFRVPQPEHILDV